MVNDRRFETLTSNISKLGLVGICRYYMEPLKYTHNPEGPLVILNLRKAIRGNVKPLGTYTLPVLYPNGWRVQEAKVKDLKSLMDFIPPSYAPFYEALQADALQNDGGVLDEVSSDDEGDDNPVQECGTVK